MSHSFSFFLFQGIHNQTRQQLAVLFNVDFVDFHSATERRLFAPLNGVFMTSL